MKFPRFDRENNLLGLAALLVVEIEATVNALIRAFFLLKWTRSNQTQGPPLEPVGVFFGQRFRAFQIDGSPMTSYVLRTASPKESESRFLINPMASLAAV